MAVLILLTFFQPLLKASLQVGCFPLQPLPNVSGGSLVLLAQQLDVIYIQVTALTGQQNQHLKYMAASCVALSAAYHAI